MWRDSTIESDLSAPFYSVIKKFYKKYTQLFSWTLLIFLNGLSFYMYFTYFKLSWPWIIHEMDCLILVGCYVTVSNCVCSNFGLGWTIIVNKKSFSLQTQTVYLNNL